MVAKSTNLSPLLRILALVGAVLATGLMLAPPYPADAQAAEKGASGKSAPSPPTPLGRDVKPKTSDGDTAELKERLHTLEDRERQTYAFILDGQRKTIDWWFSFLAVITAIVGVSGALIPYFMGRKDKDEIRRALADIRADKDSIHTSLADAQQNAQKVKEHADASERELERFVEANERLKSTNASQTADANPEAKQALRAAAQEVEGNKSASFADQLRAKAVEAELDDNYSATRDYWAALTADQPDDAQAWFGLGWALSMLSEQGGDDASLLRSRAMESYQKALTLRPDDHVAAYNSGNALAKEAAALAPRDLDAARELWQQAGERFAQALTIRSDDHKAAYNWALALSKEADACSRPEPDAARALWRQGDERFAQAVTIMPDDYNAVHDWGLLLSKEAPPLHTWISTPRERSGVKPANGLLRPSPSIPTDMKLRLAGGLRSMARPSFSRPWTSTLLAISGARQASVMPRP